MELISPFDFVKRNILAVQEYTHLSLHSLANLFRKPFYMADTIQQADLIGVGSLPIVVLTGMFTGDCAGVEHGENAGIVRIAFNDRAAGVLFHGAGTGAGADQPDGDGRNAPGWPANLAP